MTGLGNSPTNLSKRLRACNYLTVAQIFLKSNFLLSSPLRFEDIKPRLLGHWGTCAGINLAYAVLAEFYHTHPDFHFVIGPGHGFPALQANLFLDGELLKIDQKATLDEDGIAYLCRSFSWPGGFPSHASPLTPHVICEGGELGYALATAYGYVLGHPERTVAVLIGDGELETATALSSLNLNRLFATRSNGRVLPILHLNGYKISGPTLYARKSPRELSELVRGFGFTPLYIDSIEPEVFLQTLSKADLIFKDPATSIHPPFLILKTKKGLTGPVEVHGRRVLDNYLSHQVPLPHAKTDSLELDLLSNWLKSYQFSQLFNRNQGFTL